MSDINALIAAEEASQTDHIWLVTFDVLVNMEGLPADSWVNDELTVATGPDGLSAIYKVRDHISGADYPMRSKDFRLTGLKLLAVAEL